MRGDVSHAVLSAVEFNLHWQLRALVASRIDEKWMLTIKEFQYNIIILITRVESNPCRLLSSLDGEPT